MDTDASAPVRVTAVHDRDDGRLLIRTDAGDWIARALLNATGTWTKSWVTRRPRGPGGVATAA